jgi:hypothetical protein
LKIGFSSFSNWPAVNAEQHRAFARAIGTPSSIRIRKRSSCDSGSGNVPTWCCGFCVAMTKNGSGSS